MKTNLKMPPRKRAKKGLPVASQSATSSPPASLPEDLSVAGDGKGNEGVTDAEVPVVDSAGRIGTPESIDAAAEQGDAPLDETDLSDGLGGVLAEPQSSGNRPGYVARGGYNALKSFNGRVYSGMAIGGSHTWNYDQGQWKETKVEPDLWKIDFETKKHRARNAPKGSGAPVGTEYHWLVVAHQVSTNRYGEDKTETVFLREADWHPFPSC